MDHKEVVAAKLLEAGINLSDDDVDELARAYSTLVKWQTIVRGMVKPEAEPAVVFRSKTGV